MTLTVYYLNIIAFSETGGKSSVHNTCIHPHTHPRCRQISLAANLNKIGVIEHFHCVQGAQREAYMSIWFAYWLYLRTGSRTNVS